MEPKVKPDQHPLKHQGDEQEKPQKTTGTPPPPQSNPDHSVPDLQADDHANVKPADGDIQSRGTLEDAPGMNEQQQG